MLRQEAGQPEWVRKAFSEAMRLEAAEFTGLATARTPVGMEA